MSAIRIHATVSPGCSVGVRPRCYQRGMALVLVLWLIVLLSVMATGHARNARTETRLVSRQIESAQARALADAGLQRAILDLLMPGNLRQMAIDGTIYPFEFAGYEISIAIRDASGLLDLNMASPRMLGALISAAGVEEQAQMTIVDAVLDWRDADQLTRLNGAEDDDYRAAGLSWTARDGAFVSVDELVYVAGMSGDAFEKVAPYLTVFSERTGIDVEFAPAFLIAALTGQEIAISEDGATARYREKDRRGSGTYHVYVSATVDSGSGHSLEAVVRLSPEPDRPYAILAWREPMRVPVADEDLL